MISDYLIKLAQGEKMDPFEIAEMQSKVDELENKVSSWSQDGFGTLTASKLRAQDAFFQNMPMSFVVMDKQADTIIPDSSFTLIDTYGTFTPITGDRVTPSNDFFELDTTNGRIYIKQTGRAYAFYVYVAWTTNGTGHRAARLYQYKPDGTEITYSVSHRLGASPDGGTSFATFTFIPWGGERAVGDYVTLKVYQTSGGNLDLLSVAFGAFVLR